MSEFTFEPDGYVARCGEVSATIERLRPSIRGEARWRVRWSFTVGMNPDNEVTWFDTLDEAREACATVLPRVSAVVETWVAADKALADVKDAVLAPYSDAVPLGAPR